MQRKPAGHVSTKEAPFLTHTVRHHGKPSNIILELFLKRSTGQVTLVPPENEGRIRKARKKRRAQVETGDPGSDASSRSGDRRVLSRPDSASSIGNGTRVARNARATGSVSPGRPVSRDVNSACGLLLVSMLACLTEFFLSKAVLVFPSVPPPSFEEATSLPRTPDVLPVTAEPLWTMPHAGPSWQAAAARIEDSDSDASSCFEVPATLDRSGEDLWEEDRKAGLTLEERVRRQLLRIQLVEGPNPEHEHVDLLTDAANVGLADDSPLSFTNGVGSTTASSSRLEQRPPSQREAERCELGRQTRASFSTSLSDSLDGSPELTLKDKTYKEGKGKAQDDPETEPTMAHVNYSVFLHPQLFLYF